MATTQTSLTGDQCAARVREVNTADGPFRIEAWKRLECIAFTTVARPKTIKSRSSHYIVDLEAETIWVWGNTGQAIAQWQATGGWVKATLPGLRELLEGDE